MTNKSLIDGVKAPFIHYYGKGEQKWDKRSHSY